MSQFNFRSFRRSCLFAGFLVVVALLVFAAVPTSSFAAPAPAPKKDPPKRPIDIAFEGAEKLFYSGKHAAATKAYLDFQKKFDKEIKDFTVQNKVYGEAISALIHLRLASSWQSLKEWKAAESELLAFLKYPNGTGNLVEEGNDYRLAAQITLADVYGQQRKWDEAVTLLEKLRKTHTLSGPDQIRLTIAYVKALVGKAELKSPAVAKAAIQESIDSVLNPIIASRNYVVPEIRETANYVVELYTKLGKTKEARALSDAISENTTGSPLDRVKANFQRIEIAERLFQQAEELGFDSENKALKQRIYRQALTTFQETLRSNIVNSLLDAAQKIQEEKVEQTKKKFAGKTTPTDDDKAEITKAETERDNFKKAVEAFQKNTDYDGFLSYRIALCLLEVQRPWEAYIAFRDIFENSPKFSRTSTAHFYYIKALRAMNRINEAQDSCREFLTKYPGGKTEEVGEVAVLSGELFYDLEDYATAVKQFRWTRENVKSLSKEYKEWVDWYICDSLFRFQEWEPALKEIEAFLSHYPQSQQKEGMVYLRGLCYFFQGKYPETLAGMGVTDSKGYLAQYPNGRFVPDAKYRLALVKFGMKPNPVDLIKFEGEKKRKPAAWEIGNNINTENDAKEWLKTYENPDAAIKDAVDRQRPEVETLLGDVYFRYFEDRSVLNTDAERQKNLKLAIDYYVRAALGSRNNPETFGFVTRELSRRLPSQGEWGRMLEIYNTFYNWDPDSPKALEYLYWVVTAVEKLGKTPEERHAKIAAEGIKNIPEEYITKPAIEVFANAILRSINDYKKENVELLINNLAKRVYAKVNREVRGRPGIAGGDVRKIVLKEATDIITEILKYTEPSPKNIVAARTYYARAQVASVLSDSKTYNENIARIAAIYKEEELSPAILAACVEILLDQKDYVKADSFSQYILDHWRSSNYADFGFLGKGEVYLAQNKPKEALETLKEAVENGILFDKEKEILLVYARALIAVGGVENLKAAAQTLKEGSANKQWRGEYTAWCLYYLGQLEEKKGNPKEAINFYRRCFLSWKKHGVVTAKAYIRVIRLFEKLGDRAGVGGTIWDMLQDNNPASRQPEAAEARALRSGYPYTPPPEGTPESSIPVSSPPAPAAPPAKS